MQPDFSKTISFEELIKWYINWATVELNTALEYSIATLEVCEAKLDQVRKIYNGLGHTFTLLGYAFGDDDFCRHAQHREDAKAFRARVVKSTEELSERIARMQLAELNKTNAHSRLARQLVVRFDDEDSD